MNTGKIVRKLFETNRRLRITPRQQQGRTFSTKSNAGMLSLCDSGRLHEAAHGVHTSKAIRYVVDHKARQFFASI